MSRRTYDFHWNKKKSVIIRDKGFTPDFYKRMGEIFESHFYKYIPYDSDNMTSRHLADSSRITVTNSGANITYVKPYTRPQYTGVTPQGAPIQHYDTQIHPLATSYWDKACWENEKSVIGRELNNARRKYAK